MGTYYLEYIDVYISILLKLDLKSGWEVLDCIVFYVVFCNPFFTDSTPCSFQDT
jgi:hypothetical protein